MFYFANIEARCTESNDRFEPQNQFSIGHKTISAAKQAALREASRFNQQLMDMGEVTAEVKRMTLIAKGRNTGPKIHQRYDLTYKDGKPAAWKVDKTACIYLDNIFNGLA